jgi:hypothetical protein
MKTIEDLEKDNPVDEYGNVVCKICGNVQAPNFRACIYCCGHDELEITVEWHGSGEWGRWELGAVCASCGKDFDFSRDYLIRNYKFVRKTPKGY